MSQISSLEVQYFAMDFMSNSRAFGKQAKKWKRSSLEQCCLQVVPYLFRLALTDRQLYWRLAISLSFMIASKAAGTIDISHDAWLPASQS